LNLRRSNSLNKIKTQPVFKRLALFVGHG
jgi:hypothetical protein